MAPKVPEKQQQQQQHYQQPLQKIPVAIKHSNPFHISANTLCYNKRLKLKRSKYGEYLRIKGSTPHKNSLKTEVRRQKLSLLQADVTINLLSDDEDYHSEEKKINEIQSVPAYPQSMCVERAAILGLMPVARLVQPPPLAPISTNHRPSIQATPLTQTPQVIKPNKQQLQQLSPLAVSMPVPVPKPLPKQSQPQQPRKRKSKPQKRRSLPNPSKAPILLNAESIVLSDDSNDVLVPMTMPPPLTPLSFRGVVQPAEVSVPCPTSPQIPCLPQQNSMQVDEEVTISLVPRSLNASACASRSSLNNSHTAATGAQAEVFPMLPDETTVHTVIANRIYELSLTKLREGLASCGIPEFAVGQQKISPQRRKGAMQQPPLVSPPQPPISLKLSSDLSISLISDDEDDVRQKNCLGEAILSPAFLQKLPVNVSIAPLPLVVPSTNNHANESRKLKFG